MEPGADVVRKLQRLHKEFFPFYICGAKQISIDSEAGNHSIAVGLPTEAVVG